MVLRGSISAAKVAGEVGQWTTKGGMGLAAYLLNFFAPAMRGADGSTVRV